MSRRGIPVALLAAALLGGPPAGSGCAGSGGRIPEPPGGSVAVAPETALGFHERAVEFYGRLIQRRFNTLETFNDAVLRRHFRDDDGFFDYYAGLSDRLHEAYFEKSRPIDVSVEEFVFEEPRRVRVQVHFLGDDRRPLRPNRVALIRQDRWELADGQWWVDPGKL